MLQIQAVKPSDPPCWKLKGEFTIYTAAQAKAELEDHLAPEGQAQLDLAGLTELDTAGVQLLVWLKRRAEAAGGNLALLHHSPEVVGVMDLLRIAGLLGDPILIDPKAP